MARRWYVVNTYSGFENKVKLNLENRIKALNIADKIFQVMVPSEQVNEIAPARSAWPAAASTRATSSSRWS